MGTVLLGRTTAGTSADFNVSNHTTAWKFTAVASGVLATIFAQTKVTNTMTGLTLGIYSDNGSGTKPNSRLASAAVASGFNGTGVFSADVSAAALSIVSGTVYWLSWGPPAGNSDNVDFQGSTSGLYEESNASAQTPAAWPASSSGSIDAILWGEDGGGGGTTQQDLMLTGVGS